jgi:CheY-like chemotaxis protein
VGRISTSDGWFYQRDGAAVGPLSRDEIRRRVVAGELRPDDAVWQGWSPRGYPVGAVPAATLLSKKRLSVLLVGKPAGPVARLRPLMRRWGHQARLARTGLEAVRLARRGGPDVVLLDLDAPGVDGDGFAASLAAGSAGPPPVLVALARPGAEAAGFRYCLEKPADPNVLALLLALVGQERGAGLAAPAV